MNLNKYRITSASAYPEYLQLEVSRACMLGCPQCRRTRFDPDGNGELAGEVLEKLEPVIAQADMLDVSGWGEPLSSEMAWKVFEVSHWSRTNSCLTTNGMLLTEANCRELVERQVGQVTVSLDAGTPEGLRRLRPGADLDEITGGIRRLARMREELGSATPFIVAAFNFQEAAAEEFPAFIRLAAKLPVCKVVVHPCFAQGEGEEGEAVCRLGGREGNRIEHEHEQEHEHEKKRSGMRRGGECRQDAGATEMPAFCRRAFEEGMALAGELGVKAEVFLKAILEAQLGITAGGGWENHYFPTLQEIRKRGLFPTCRCAWDFPFVDHEGNVYPCNHYPIPMGNLHRNSFEEIWDNERFNQFRHNLVTHQPNPICLACPKTMWYPNSVYAPHPEHLPLGAEGLVGLGWYPVEQVGKSDFRWSRGMATVYLHNGGKPKLYFVASALRETQVNVAVEGRRVGTLRVRNFWDISSIDLPAFAGPVLRVSFSCPDAQGDPASAMPRHRMRLLGIAVSQIGMCTAENDEEPRQALRRVKSRAFPLRFFGEGIGRWMKMLFMP